MTSHIEVIQNWYDKTGQGKRGFNIFYDSDIIYSYGYHFPLARHTHNKQGNRAVLVTTQGYSVSTEKHKTFVNRVVGYDSLTAFSVDNVLAETKSDHRKNYVHAKVSISAFLGKAKRARKYKQLWIDDALRLAEMLNRYSKFFKLGYSRIDI